MRIVAERAQAEWPHFRALPSQRLCQSLVLEFQGFLGTSARFAWPQRRKFCRLPGKIFLARSPSGYPALGTVSVRLRGSAEFIIGPREARSRWPSASG
jgi:hypothetical protein